jgi:hypothetical protein
MCELIGARESEAHELEKQPSMPPGNLMVAAYPEQIVFGRWFRETATVAVFQG